MEDDELSVAQFRQQTISESRIQSARGKLAEELKNRHVSVLILSVDEDMALRSTGTGITPAIAKAYRKAINALDDRLALIEAGLDPRDMPPEVRASSVKSGDF